MKTISAKRSKRGRPKTKVSREEYMRHCFRKHFLLDVYSSYGFGEVSGLIYFSENLLVNDDELESFERVFNQIEGIVGDLQYDWRLRELAWKVLLVGIQYANKTWRDSLERMTERLDTYTNVSSFMKHDYDKKFMADIVRRLSGLPRMQMELPLDFYDVLQKVISLEGYEERLGFQHEILNRQPSDLLRKLRKPRFPAKLVTKLTLAIKESKEAPFPERIAKALGISVEQLTELRKEANRQGKRVSLLKGHDGKEFLVVL